jgi:murein DD-endopeptidase MepM/ murein hydrolase activator NlpD
VRIIARRAGADGTAVEATRTVPLKVYEQKNEFIFPIRGASVAAVSAGMSEPHRWAMNEEFAVDIVRVGTSGRTCRGQCAKLTDYYGWGADVVSVADGVVVRTVTNQQESSDRFRRAEQETLLRSGSDSITGNVVVIRHSGGEFSHFAHLAHDSIVVKAAT